MEAMQVAASCAAPSGLSLASASCQRRSPARSQRAGVRMLSAFGGLKAESKVTSLGVACSTEQEFASMVARCRAVGSGASRGGAAAATCNVGQEILTIVPIMSGLVLVGIAIGFVLLRVEAAVEESEL